MGRSAAKQAGLGLLRAALFRGIGSESRRPFAVGIVDVIVAATLFTLLLLPLLLALFAKKVKSNDCQA